MTITVSYRDYVNKMGRAFSKVKYNEADKTITIDLNTGGVDFDQGYIVLAMDDKELLALVRSNKADATIEEARAAVDDTIERMVTMYHSDGKKSVTAEAIKAAAEYIKK